ncbi:MAG: Sugar phosphate permease [Phenylobacterium sp.]|nr:Sugar phosphate permease [Phenylobacterium sp.]
MGVMSTSNVTESEALYPPPRAAWFACTILFLGCALAFMDRGVISLFIIPIQRDLHLSDTQISLLVGFAFAAFNALFGLPVARWIDGGPRKTIAAIGIAVWSLAASSCGLATNFWQLFIGRVALGAGEASVTPAGVSLLADLFPPKRRGRAMGLFYAGTFVGGGCALVLGGFLWRSLGDRLMALPLVGPLHSWQVVLILVGSLGFIVAPLTLLIPEPRRLDGGGPAVVGGVPLAAVARYYKTHARTLAGHNVGFCLQNFALHAGAAWLPTLLVRTAGWSIAQAGATIGLMTLVLGPIGAATAGALADALAIRGRTDGKLIVCIGSAGMCAAAATVIAINPIPSLLIAALGAFMFFGAFSLPLGPGALQEIMPNAMRGQATAVYVAVTNLVGGGLAATTVALLTDFVFHDKAKLNLSFGLVGVVVCILAALTLTATLRAFRTTVRERLGPAQLGPAAAAA